MEEILEELKNEINTIKSEQDKLEVLAENSEKFRLEEKELQQELNSIEDKGSGFYKDLSEQISEKHDSFTVANNERMNKDKEINKLISEKKETILNEVVAKKQYLDENRKANLENINLDELKAEKEKLEKEIELNDTTKEQFIQMNDSEKQAVRKAKENYLNNKHRLDEINPTIELMDLLDGKTAKERYIELSNLEKMIEKNFNRDNLDKMLENIDNEQEGARKKNEEEAKRKKQEEIKENKLRAARVLSEKYGIIKGDILYDKIMESIDLSINVSDVSEIARTELIAMIYSNTNGIYDKDIEKLQKEMDIAGIKYDDIKEAEEAKIKEQEEAERKIIEAKEAERKRREAEEAERKKIEAEGKRIEQEEAERKRREAEEKAKKDREIAEKSKDVKIVYNAKTNEYKVTNLGLNKEYMLAAEKVQESIDDVDKVEIANEYNLDESQTDNIHLKVMAILVNYDEIFKTHKTVEYFKEVTTIGQYSKEDRIKNMNELGIDITYDLKGLYDRDAYGDRKYSKEERREILEVANNAKAKGIAKVNKGLKVKFGEMLDKITSINPKNLFKQAKEQRFLNGKTDDVVEIDKLNSKEANKNNLKEKGKNAVNSLKEKAQKFGEEIRQNVDEEEAAIEAQRKANVKKDMKEEKEEQK